MKTLWLWICVLDTCLVSSYLTFHGHKVLRVQLETEEHLTLIQSMDKIFNLDFWHPDSSARIAPMMTVDIHIHANQSDAVLQLLKQNTVPFEVLFHNLQEGIEAQLDNRNVRDTKKYSYSKYNDWETIAEWTCKVATNHPHLVSRLEIGNTFEDRPMYVLKMIDTGDLRRRNRFREIETKQWNCSKVGTQSSAKTAIFLECGVHAREWISPAFCQWFVRELVTGYSNDQSIKDLLTDLTFYILPVFNIDGYIYTWTKDRMWRKNRSPAPNSKCCGTDLNRNFNISWCEIGSSDDPCTPIYCGHSAESEKETKNVATFIRSNLDSIKAYISIHSYSQMLLYPYSYTYDPAPNSEELDEISKGAVSELQSLYGTKYVYGPSASTIYPTSGSSDDWAYTQGIKYAFTFELRDKGKRGFLLPESQIKATSKETALAIKYIANYVLSHSS